MHFPSAIASLLTLTITKTTISTLGLTCCGSASVPSPDSRAMI